MVQRSSPPPLPFWFSGGVSSFSVVGDFLIPWKTVSYLWVVWGGIHDGWRFPVFHPPWSRGSIPSAPGESVGSHFKKKDYVTSCGSINLAVSQQIISVRNWMVCMVTVGGIRIPRLGYDRHLYCFLSIQVFIFLTWHVRGGGNLTIVGSTFYLHTDTVACEYCI